MIFSVLQVLTGAAQVFTGAFTGVYKCLQVRLQVLTGAFTGAYKCLQVRL